MSFRKPHVESNVRIANAVVKVKQRPKPRQKPRQNRRQSRKQRQRLKQKQRPKPKEKEYAHLVLSAFLSSNAADLVLI